MDILDILLDILLKPSQPLMGLVFSCRGGSKLRFGGSYVKIGQELASGVSF